MFSKVLVANRGEIAVRAFRAAYELGAQTVAVYPYEDRNAVHRIKADEAYEIGERGHPVRAYLDIDGIIRAAVDSGADAIYPGYGFLSENPDLARACDAAGITFIGPPADVLELAGNKVRAIGAARAAGIPTLKSTPPSDDVETLVAGAEEVGYPVFVKAVAGGGGRGMRRVDGPAQLRDALDQAMREADSAFGDPTVFIEQAVSRPRHIEVQILADQAGNTMHLFERDCSLQRRHQKVIELAPAPNISDELRAALTGDAVKFAESLHYSCAGTVEFLVETEGPRAGQHVFIEMNPRIQVEHTVTEEITGVDLVQAQLRIASGAEVGVVEHRLQERDVRRHPTDAELGDRPPRPVHRGGKVPAPAGQFDQHRIEVWADLRAQVGAAVEADTGPARAAVGGDPAGVGPETVGRVLGGDPALQRRAVRHDVVLAQAQIRQGLPGGDPQLRRDQVDVGDLLGDGVLHLDSRVHLDEHVVAALVEQELHRARAAVADVPGERDGVGTDLVPQHRIQVRCRGQLDDLLVPALHAAVPLKQVHHVAVGVGEHLHLDVAWVDHRLLEIHGRIPEGRFGFPTGGFDGLGQPTPVSDPAHPTTTPARDRLDEQGERHVGRGRHQVVDRARRLRGRQHRQAGLPRRRYRVRLVAGQRQHRRAGAHEGDALVGTGLGQSRVLREEAVPGVDRICTAPLGSGDNGLHRQVATHRVPRLADLVGLVRLEPVHRIAVFIGVDRNRVDSEFIGGAERADGDLSAVGDQHFGDHRAPLKSASTSNPEIEGIPTGITR